MIIIDIWTKFIHKLDCVLRKMSNFVYDRVVSKKFLEAYQEQVFIRWIRTTTVTKVFEAWLYSYIQM